MVGRPACLIDGHKQPNYSAFGSFRINVLDTRRNYGTPPYFPRDNDTVCACQGLRTIGLL